jgi:hypothetical protein
VVAGQQRCLLPDRLPSQVELLAGAVGNGPAVGRFGERHGPDGDELDVDPGGPTVRAHQ